MARNAEKAQVPMLPCTHEPPPPSFLILSFTASQAMLNRIVTAKKEAARGVEVKRPYLAEECHNLHDAERFSFAQLSFAHMDTH